MIDAQSANAKTIEKIFSEIDDILNVCNSRINSAISDCAFNVNVQYYPKKSAANDHTAKILQEKLEKDFGYTVTCHVSSDEQEDEYFYNIDISWKGK